MSKILVYVDDSADDRFLFRSACRLANVELQPLLIEAGEEAILYFDRHGQYADRGKFPDPDLVLLDIKMPKVDGFDLLQRLRSRPEYNNCPIGLLSSSNQSTDIERARALGATWYFLKPTELHQLADLVLLLDDCLNDPTTCDDGPGQLSKFTSG